MSDISLRMNRLIAEKRLNKRSLSALIGYSDVAIGKIINGKTKPKFEMMEALVGVFPDINPTWLLTGRGEMLLKEGENPVSELVKTGECEKCKALEEKINLLNTIIETKDQVIEAYRDNRDSNEDSKDENRHSA